MLTKKRYSIKEMALWTRYETFLFLGISLAVTLLYDLAGFTFLNVPWTPVALIGTAVAFMVGFQNNSAYGRIWEARKIWGGIVNTSRTWGMKIQDMITNEYAREKESSEHLRSNQMTLIYRHIAWMTALRHAMRQTKSWEVFTEHKTNMEWSDMIHIPEWENALEDELKPHLSDEELKHVLSKGNKSAAILYLQSSHLRALKEKGLIWEFAFLELENLLQELFTLQGKSERIKNFPYPRQYATLSHVFVWVFLLLLPFGIIPEFDNIGQSIKGSFPLIGEYFIWLGVPFCAAVSWVFHTMQRIGTVGENPFEGSANDVPISTIARGIEIDLKQLMNDDAENIPEQFPVQHSVAM